MFAEFVLMPADLPRAGLDDPTLARGSANQRCPPVATGRHPERSEGSHPVSRPL